MRSEELSVKERAVLFTLLAEAREMSNPELEERFGFRLDGKERRKLNDLKLVESTRPDRAFVHELTDAGWRWCADELSAGPGPNPSSMERALYAVFNQFGRYLQGTDQRLADIFNLRYAKQSADGDQQSGTARDAGAAILAAYAALAAKPGEFVKLSALRERLADVSRADTDAALGQLYRDQRINLIPQSNQRALTANDRASALRLGGEEKHMLSVRPQ
ncbi:MAG TPA: hypothetical protein VGI21_23505 [Streptosporangiaceae bacterium]|jgi:hypothetical protein